MLRAVFTVIAFLFISLRNEIEGAVTSFSEETLGLGDSYVGVFAVTRVVGVFFAVALGWIRIGPRRWTFNHAVTISASPAVVWDAIYPRSRSNPFLETFQRIEKIPGEQGAFHFIRHEADGHDASIPVEVYVVDGVKEQELFIETHTPDDLADLYDYETDFYQLRKTEGGTHVSLKMTLFRPSLYFVICCYFGAGPAKSTLTQLNDFTRRTQVSRPRRAMFGSHA